MKTKYFNRILPNTRFLIVLLSVALYTGCSDSFFNKQPLDQASDATFWKTAGDAQLALIGCYNTGAGTSGGWKDGDFWTPRSMVYLDLMAGDGSEKELIPDHVTDGTLNAAYWVTQGYWNNSYKKIAVCNNFLDHIGGITMDATKKAIITAEVRTLRAYEYFNIALYFGDVPLIKKLLSIDEALKVTRAPKADVWAFVETELKESAPVLPVTRPDAEAGRLTSGAAYGILGRLQMAEKKWSDAAITYKTIIDFNCYVIDPLYRELFLSSNESSKEFIMTSQFQKDVYGNVLLTYLLPETWGGWHQFSPYNELVKEYECTDGKTIDQSPLYDKNNPYRKRDPRLLATLMVTDTTVFRGITFVSRPGTTSADRKDKYPNWSGYCIYKFLEDDVNVNQWSSGTNFTLIRYAEVLLSYLESKMEAGQPVDQTLLDATINKVRGRAAVNMPPVTTTDPAALRTIIRRERKVEFAFEGIHYFDILRWGTAAQELNRQFTGMKLTNSPATYTDYAVDADGYFVMPNKRNFKAGVNELWPVPQTERDINPNLTQNTGY